MILANWPDSALPDVEIVRTVTTRADWLAARLNCITAAGFEAHESEDGGIEYDLVPDGQEQAFAIANYVCVGQYPVGNDPLPVTDDGLRTLYAYYTDSLIPCLEQQGYVVEDTPSLATFLDRYPSEGWSPYTSVSPRTQEDWELTNRVCPQHPKELLSGRE